MTTVTRERGTSPLCSNCRVMFNSKGIYYNKYRGLKHGYHSTFEQLLQAKDNGCHLCTILWHDFSLYLGSTTTGSIEYLFIQYGMDDFSIQFKTNGLSKTIEWSSVYRQPLLKVQADSRAEDVSAWITQQLKICAEDHINCWSREVSYLPDRVIDVGFAEQDFVRLQIMKNGPNQGRFLTLSHRWGNAEFLKLTADNESSLKEKIPIPDLPQTFQDAIEVTRSVGFRYLWIDSLCIRQDSPTDWREQSAKMGAIYRNCHFNIAATAASEDGVGLFSHQSPLIFLSVYVHVDITQKGGDHPTFKLFHYDRAADEYDMVTNGKALHRRGWVLQERLLSPRVVNFGNGGIVWECWEKTILEHNKELPSSIQVHKLNKFKDIKTLPRWLETLSQKITMFPDGKDSLIRQTYHRWHRLVFIYSQASLTEWNDKLIAISGLADLARRNTGDKYLAGLWQGNLAGDLVWMVDRGKPILQDRVKPSLGIYSRKNDRIVYPEWGDAKWNDAKWLDEVFAAGKEPSWRAPTWSWAHLDVPVHFRMSNYTGEETKVMITLMDSQIIPEGHDVCGQLKSAQLTLRGRLIEVQGIISFVSDGGCLEIKSGSGEWDLYPDTRLTIGKLQSFESVRGHLWILPVLVEGYWAKGLLLEHDELNAQYRRLGGVDGHCGSSLLDGEGKNDDCEITLV